MMSDEHCLAHKDTDFGLVHSIWQGMHSLVQFAL